MKSGQTIKTNPAGAEQCRQAGKSGDEWTPKRALGPPCICLSVLLHEDTSQSADHVVWTEAEEKCVPSPAYQ